MRVGYSTFREISTIGISCLSFLAVSVKLIAARGWNGLFSYIQLALNSSAHRRHVAEHSDYAGFLV
jgi:hypothetical protein